MCVEKSRPVFDKSKYIEAPQRRDVALYCREITEKDLNVIRLYEFEEAYVVCPTKEITILTEPGFYKIYSRPARVVWVRRTALELTIGVPRTSLPYGYGVNVTLTLLPRGQQLLASSLIKSGEVIITLDEIKDELRKLLRIAVTNRRPDPNKDRKEVIKEIHEELNELLKRSQFNMFVCDVLGVGFSHECELSKFLGDKA